MTPSQRVMLYSNAFFILPVIFSALYREWAYLFLAAGVLVWSTLYHWQQINARISPWIDRIDVAFAIGAFGYMYYYAFRHNADMASIFYVLFTILILFYWLGRRYHYQRLHPWFHVLIPVVSAASLIAAH